ncbi:NF038215 family lipoprotein [Acinetobacter sp. TSRC1-2]|uniref:NF038215 family lipoprotein n=1 Tax=unclassified Acinetobacter TaxID=196816 RepID=UPI003CEF569B
MKKLSVGLSVCLLLLLTACDAKDDYNKPKAEVRTMIIGGMPVHDHDYRLSQLNAREIKPVVQQ